MDRRGPACYGASRLRGVEDVRGGEDSGGQRRALILGLAVVCCAGPACFYHPQGSPDATDASTSAPGTGTASTSSSGDTDGSGTGVTSGAPLPEPPAATSLQLAFSQVKQFEFSWPAAAGATYYQLLERLPGAADHVQLGGDLVGESASLTMPLHLRFGASYLLRACNDAGCTDSAPVDVVDSMAAAVGYFKASNTGPYDYFGLRLALSADGDTLAVGAGDEDGGDGTEADNSVVNAGAVYVFARANDNWSQQAYVKSTAPAEIETFGRALALASDGRTLAVGTATEAVHVFVRPDSDWSHQGLVQADVPGADLFGWSVALSADGDVLAVGAQEEDGAARGINGPQRDESTDAGAAYVFVREGGAWSQRAYVKASNTATGEGGKGDFFGTAVALSADGGTLAVGAPEEDSAAIDIGGNADNDSAPGSGAVYLY